MIPHTVPNSPINGAAEPKVARNGSRASSRRISPFRASRIARSTRSRRSPVVSLFGGTTAALSCSPATSTWPAGSRAVRGPAHSSSGERAAAARASCERAERLIAASRHSLSIMTAQLHTEAKNSRINTPLTTMSALRNRLTIEMVGAGSIGSIPALDHQNCHRGASGAQCVPSLHPDNDAKQCTEQIDRLENDGWELVTSSSDDSGHWKVLILKRPKSQISN